MEITAGFHTPRTAWRRWSDFRGFPCRPTFCRTSSWGVRLGTRSAVSPCCGSSRSLPAVRLGLLLAAVAFVPGALLAQLTTGAIEGTLRATDGRPVAASPILITGGAGFRAVIHSNSNGEFAVTLPYGRYCLSGGVQRGAASSGATVFVAPLQTARFDLVMDASGVNAQRATGGADSGYLGRCHERAAVSRGVQLAGAAAEPGAVQCNRATRFHWPQRQPAGGRVTAGILLDRYAIQVPGHGCDRLLPAGTSGGLARRPGAR